jgi:hypothetical protein
MRLRRVGGRVVGRDGGEGLSNYVEPLVYRRPSSVEPAEVTMLTFCRASQTSANWLRRMCAEVTARSLVLVSS